MAKVTIDAYRSSGRPFRVAIEENATIGAQVGTNLTLTSSVTLISGQVLPAGYVLQPVDLLNGLIPSTSGTGSGTGSDWSLITNIPANVSAVAGLATVGMAVRQTGGTWVTRSLANGAGISLTNASGDAGNPTVAHADTSSVADLNSNNSGTVVLQDFAITFDTFGHVQTVSVGTVDVATALASTFQPLDATLTALAAANWVQNAFPIGTGADTLSQVSFAANTFPARASTGDLVAKTITDFGLSLVDDANAAAGRTTLGALSKTGDSATGNYDFGTNVLYIDDTNNRVGMGTATPQRPAHVVGPSGAVASFPSAVGAAVPVVVENNGNATTAYVPSATGAGGIVVYKSGSATTNAFFRYDCNLSRWLMDVEGTTKWTSDANGFQFGSGTPSFGGGVGVLGVTNATTVPTSNPTGGAVWYCEAGASKARGSSGTVTTFAAANPHCPRCGSDFVHEWDNAERWGYLAVCMNCHADGINSHTRARGAWNTDKE